MLQEITRTSLDWLAQEPSDYLLVDMGLLRSDFHELESGHIFCAQMSVLNKLLEEEGIIPKLKRVLPFDYMSDDEMKKRLKIYCDKLLKMYPPERIILFEVSYATSCADFRANTITNFSLKRMRYDERSRYIRHGFTLAKDFLKGCHVVNFPENVLGDAQHPWGKMPLHFTHEYYDYGLNAINIICREQLAREEEMRRLEQLRQKYGEIYKKIREDIEKKTFYGNQISFANQNDAKYCPLAERNINKNEMEVQTVYSLLSTDYERALLCKKGSFPVNAGLAAVGYITKVGSAVKNFRPGDRIFAAKAGHASFIISDKLNMVRIPQNVPLEEAVFTHAAATALAAVRRAHAEIGEPAAVVGAGPVGQFAIKFAKMSGCYPIFAVENDEQRRVLAKKAGADFALSGDDPSLAPFIADIAKRKTSIRGVRIVIDACGSEDAFLNSLNYAAENARIVRCAIEREEESSPAPLAQTKWSQLICRKGLSISQIPIRPRNESNPGNWTAAQEYTLILNLLSDGKLSVRDMITRFVSPKDAAKVYAQLASESSFPLGVIFDWRTESENAACAPRAAERM